MLKHIWSQDYVSRKYGNGNLWIKEKKRELEAETGLSWSVDSVGKMWRFLPCLDKEMMNSRDYTEQSISRVLEALRQRRQKDSSYMSFLALAEETGLSLWKVISASGALIRTGLVRGTVNRNGRLCFVRIPGFNEV